MFGLQGSFFVGELAGGQVINEGAHVIMQLIFCYGFIDDILEVGRPVTWTKWKHKPDNQVFLSDAPKLFNACRVYRDLPEPGKQVHDRLDTQVAYFKNHVPDVRDGEAAAFGA